MRPPLTLLAGLAGSLLVGSGLVAVGTDAVSSPGNAITSPSVAPLADIEVATWANPNVHPNSAVCTGWSDETVVPMTWASGTTTGELNVPPLGGWPGDSGWESPTTGFCVRNVGRGPVALAPLFTNVLSEDLGCGPDEPAFDAGCATPGDAGELDDLYAVPGPNQPITRVRFIRRQSGGSAYDRLPLSCAQNPTCVAAEVQPWDLAPGQTLYWKVELRWEGGLDESQTDRIQWDLVFTATEAS